MQLLRSKKNNFGIYEVLMAFKLLIMHLSQFGSWTPSHLVEQFQHLKTACEAFNGMNSMAPASLWPWHPTFCNTKLDAVPWQADLRVWKSGLAALSILSSTGKSRERSSAFPPSRSMPEVEANPLRILVCYDGEKYLHAMPPRNCHEKRTNNLVLFWIASYQELHLKAAHHLFLEPCKTYKRELMIDTLKPSSVVPGSKTWVLGRWCVGRRDLQIISTITTINIFLRLRHHSVPHQANMFTMLWTGLVKCCSAKRHLRLIEAPTALFIFSCTKGKYKVSTDAWHVLSISKLIANEATLLGWQRRQFVRPLPCNLLAQGIIKESHCLVSSSKSLLQPTSPTR